MVVSENSGRSDGSLFQHFCKSSASFGLIFFGIVGRNPCKVQNTHIKTKGRTWQVYSWNKQLHWLNRYWAIELLTAGYSKSSLKERTFWTTPTAAWRGVRSEYGTWKGDKGSAMLSLEDALTTRWNEDHKIHQRPLSTTRFYSKKRSSPAILMMYCRTFPVRSSQRTTPKLNMSAFLL